jgi:hypothetical protein
LAPQPSLGLGLLHKIRHSSPIQCRKEGKWQENSVRSATSIRLTIRIPHTHHSVLNAQVKLFFCFN